jgi:N-acyl-D-amino-acid deacylase
VAFDQYPYTAGSTMLTVLLPPWVRQGESADVLARLRDDEVRERIAADIAEPGEWENLTRAAGTWENILITRTASGRYQADTIEDVSAAMDREPVDAICELLVEEELDVTMGGLRDVREGHRAVPRRPPGNLLYGQYLRRETHPWAIGTFGRILERYVREWGVLSPERTVQKTAGAPADVLGFPDRGYVREGYVADLVVFDLETVSANATYQDPYRSTDGIEYVFVGSESAVEDGTVTGTQNGSVLRSIEE